MLLRDHGGGVGRHAYLVSSLYAEQKYGNVLNVEVHYGLK